METSVHHPVGPRYRSFSVVWLVTLASVPLSLRWTVFSTGTEVAAPLEFLVVACGMYLAFCWVRGGPVERWMVVNPVSIVIATGVMWMLVTSMTSVDPVVSLKYSLARMAYVVTFFVGGMVLLSQSKKAFDRAVWTGLAGLMPVVLWTFGRHASSGFSLKTSIEVGKPFYSNHLEYGATLTFWMLVLVGMAAARRLRSGGFGGAAGLVAVGLLPVVWAAHSRSAWLALIMGFAAIVLCRSGVGVRGMLVAAAITLTVFSAAVALCLFDGFRADGDRRQSGSVEDPSITERFNRWACAVRMAELRPLVGFGPGTYETSYAVFQHYDEMTSHSSLKGDRGDAHSEFFSALAEQGAVGLLLVVLVFAAALRSAVRACVYGLTASQRWLAFGWTGGIVALAVGNLFNSFLEVDRVAPLVWLACAAVVVMERNFETTSQENR